MRLWSDIDNLACFSEKRWDSILNTPQLVTCKWIQSTFLTGFLPREVWGCWGRVAGCFLAWGLSLHHSAQAASHCAGVVGIAGRHQYAPSLLCSWLQAGSNWNYDGRSRSKSHVLCSACNRCRLNERTKPNPLWFWECRSWWVAVSFVITPLSTFTSFSSLVISSAFLFGAQGRVKSVERRWGVIGSEVRVILLAQLQAPGRTHGQFHQSVPPLVRLPLGNSTWIWVPWFTVTSVTTKFFQGRRDTLSEVSLKELGVISLNQGRLGVMWEHPQVSEGTSHPGGPWTD